MKTKILQTILMVAPMILAPLFKVKAQDEIIEEEINESPESCYEIYLEDLKKTILFCSDSEFEIAPIAPELGPIPERDIEVINEVERPSPTTICDA